MRLREQTECAQTVKTKVSLLLKNRERFQPNQNSREIQGYSLLQYEVRLTARRFWSSEEKVPYRIHSFPAQVQNSGKLPCLRNGYAAAGIDAKIV